MNSLQLMKMFTENRKPFRVYNTGETRQGQEFLLSDKQLRWLLETIYKEMPKDAPSGFNPIFGTTYTDKHSSFTLHSLGKRPAILKSDVN